MITIEQEEFWRSIDPEWWKEIDNVMQPYVAPIRVNNVTGQRLTTWSNPLDIKGGGQFVFQVGKYPNKTTIKLNFSWSNVGAGSTETLNRWYEELQYLFRNEQGIKIYKSTAYLPNTQDFQQWCQFIEVRQYNSPKQAFCIWNGDIIIPSYSKLIIRENARDWTFDWKQRKSLKQMLELVKDLN